MIIDDKLIIPKKITSNGESGQLRFNSDTKKFQGYTGDDWKELGSGAASSSLSDPFNIMSGTIDILDVTSSATIESLDVTNNLTIPINSRIEGQSGQLRFNSTENKFQGYTGVGWKELGSASGGSVDPLDISKGSIDVLDVPGVATVETLDVEETLLVKGNKCA